MCMSEMHVENKAVMKRHAPLNSLKGLATTSATVTSPHETDINFASLGLNHNILNLVPVLNFPKTTVLTVVCLHEALMKVVLLTFSLGRCSTSLTTIVKV